jgi:single-strand DNA-binding protein
MTDINIVGVLGRLTRDGELTYTNTGFPIGSFSIANNYSRKSGEEWVEEVSYFDVKLFGKQAEAIQPYLNKGQQVMIKGHLQQERWQSKEGDNRQRVVIIAESVQLIGTRRQSDAEPGNLPDSMPL